MARQIGQFGLLAAVVSLLGMAAPFSYKTFVVEGKPWSVELLEPYLHFLIQSITILVVRCVCDMSAQSCVDGCKRQIVVVAVAMRSL